MKRMKYIFTTLFLMVTVVVSAQGVQASTAVERNKEVKETLELDYSMPDYSIDKIDAKVMGGEVG